MKNAIIGQSGGPTAAINATLSGVVRELVSSQKVNIVYGMHNGVEGLLEEKLCNLSYILFAESDLVKLEKTPAAVLGSCRLKMPDPLSTDPKDISLYSKLFQILDKNNIGYFFYIGGNDSMDTIRKLSLWAKNHNSDIKFVGVPKTIDNDLACTDHSPGYGSAAKYVATSISEILRDTAVYSIKAVTIVEIMGRDAGWLTAAASLAGPDLIYLPEVPFNVDNFIEDVKNVFEKKPNVVIAVSEGIRDDKGVYISQITNSATVDAFGHKQLSGTGRCLESIVKDAFGCKVRNIELSLLQRCAAHIASKTDIDESIKIGSFAASLALAGESGCMAAFDRVSTSPYSCICKKVDLDSVANYVRNVPHEFINERGNNLTLECVKWIRPLILGESIPDFENGLPVQMII